MPQGFLIWNLLIANTQVCVKNIYVDMIDYKSMLSYLSFSRVLEIKLRS